MHMHTKVFEALTVLL